LAGEESPQLAFALGIVARPREQTEKGTAEPGPERGLRRQPKTRFSLPIADCRLTIEKVVWQLLPMFISNRKSAIPAILKS
jgi:hypothetical protein